MAIILNETSTLAVTTTDPMLFNKAHAIATQLSLPFVENAENCPWALMISTDRLALKFPGAKHPFAVDLAQGAYIRRLQRASIKKEPLARAVGLKPGIRCHVLDGTAGWGSDAGLLAKLGAHVTAVERSPIVAALLADGLRRLQLVPDFSEMPITLEVADVMDYLKHSDVKPDVIYLDPMFPEKPHSAQVKKPMQLLQALVGESQDAEQLLSTTLTSGCPRIVVKRPTWAEALIQKPSFTVPAGMIRFDVYLL